MSLLVSPVQLLLRLERLPHPQIPQLRHNLRHPQKLKQHLRQLHQNLLQPSLKQQSQHLQLQLLQHSQLLSQLQKSQQLLQQKLNHNQHKKLRLNQVQRHRQHQQHKHNLLQNLKPSQLKKPKHNLLLRPKLNQQQKPRHSQLLQLRQHQLNRNLQPRQVHKLSQALRNQQVKKLLPPILIQQLSPNLSLCLQILLSSPSLLQLNPVPRLQPQLPAALLKRTLHHSSQQPLRLLTQLQLLPLMKKVKNSHPPLRKTTSGLDLMASSLTVGLFSQ